MPGTDDPFFSPLEAPPEPEPTWDPLSQPDWLRVPWEVAPAVVGEPVVVAASADFAVVLAPLLVYDRGLVLELTLIRNPWGEAKAATLMGAQHGPHGRAPGGFRAGVRWADGRTARTDVHRSGWDGDDAPAASMVTRGGGGSSDATGSSWWVWPLPEAGDLDLVIEFTDGGIAETSQHLDGDAIRAAAARTTPIWQPPAARR